MATYPVKYLHSGMRGAPALPGTAGTLVSMIDACLFTGFGQVTLTSLVVSGGVATATVSAGDTFDEYAVILIDGATPAALNGEQRVLSSTSTTFTFATTAPDGAATGTITAKYAPVGGWEKSFSGTNKAVYKSTDAQANGHYLRVDDSGAGSAAYARVRGYESMSDVDTGTGPFPTDAQASGGGWWHKSTNASASPVKWAVFGDSRFFALAIAPGSSSNENYVCAPAMGFGDAVPLDASDAWVTVLSAPSSSVATIGRAAFDSTFSSAGNFVVAPRARGGMSGAVILDRRNYLLPASNMYSGDASGALGDFPLSVGGRVFLAKNFVRDTTNSSPRAEVPGILFVPQKGIGGYARSMDIIQGSDDLAGRRLCAVQTGDNVNANPPTGCYFVDITGPWH